MKFCGSQTPSGHSLQLQILSIEIMNRTGDKEQRWFGLFRLVEKSCLSWRN